MRRIFVVLLSAAFIASPLWALDWIKKPAMEKAGDKWTISFEMDELTDVEVAIVNAKGKVVRHLAAGVLGKNPPPPLKADSKSQTLTWDGKNDYREAAKHGPFKVRVRAGMGTKLVTIVGGDPYTSYSKVMAQGDHSGWRLTGIDVKPDGKVYVLANMNYSGQPAIRQFDAAGNYQKTVFPPPAGLPADKVKGWGIITHEDGSYSYQYSDLGSVALSKTFISGWRAPVPYLIPSPDKDSLLLCQRGHFKLMKVGTDGSIAANPHLEGPLVTEPSLFEKTAKGRKACRVSGQLHFNLAPGGKHYYVSALFAGKYDGWRRKRSGALKTGFWRDGQVFKVDAVTRKAEAFFTLDADKVIEPMQERSKSGIADARYGNYAALQGAVADKEGHVFVGDRQNRRILILDQAAKIVREIPCAYPDALAVNPKSKTLYVTTRKGHYHGAGMLTLLKFNDWSKDDKPTASIPLCRVCHFSQRTHLATAQANGEVYVWVAYTALPVRIYKDKGSDLELVKDFYEAGPQRALGIEHMMADQSNDNVYVMDCGGYMARVSDWKNPRFERCMMTTKKPLGALSLAINPRKGHVFVHTHMGTVRRYAMEGDAFKPAPVGESGISVTGPMCNDWRIGLGQGDRGLAAAPDGSLATLGTLQKGGAAYGGPLNFFKADAAKAPWTPLAFKEFDKKSKSAGIRFDLQGNLYAGKYDGAPKNPTKGFEKYPDFVRSTGRIYKFAPTGKPGNLFPTPPEKPTKIYDINYGSISPRFSRTPRFGVDGWGRIYYPTTLLPKVSVMDNEGNGILKFGTWGNRDSMGGLEGDLVPTKDIPMAFPNSVDATDDYIYVADMINRRLLRIEKTFKLK